MKQETSKVNDDHMDALRYCVEKLLTKKEVVKQMKEQLIYNRNNIIEVKTELTYEIIHRNKIDHINYLLKGDRCSVRIFYSGHFIEVELTLSEKEALISWYNRF